ncbi:Ig-like domain-containing protein, partial [uncultured Agrococcus sp.]|uniref:Ig-like domain-containing protein n=1 Tax=uncultured Agrococcus sp. TaxID=382258 RepID=UPI0025D77AB0
MTLTIRDEGENAAPEELREQGFEVEQRAEYEHGVLESWFDPDGDDLFLIDAFSDSGDTVRFSPNGRIVYTATGEPGPTTMTVIVSDGVDEEEASIAVEVRERGTSTPIANADYVSARVNQSTSIRPLDNDFLPAGENARLASATPRGDVTVDIDRATNTLYVTGGSIGTHFVDYTVASGPSQAQGHVRIDIAEPVEDATPVAVRDVALLPMGGEALVDLTANDVDPAGGVLVVQSVDADGAPVAVQLLQRHMLRIEDQQGLGERTTLRYHISNGANTATGEIVVIPVEPPDKPRNPVAMDDTATLRAGDYTTVHITENDFSPDGVPFSVSPQLVESSLLPEEGHVFVDGDSVRVHVGVDGPPFVDVVYEISDAAGNTDTASLRVEVEPRNIDTNNPPHAMDVTARVLAGNVVRIPIPLNGIDPDGDGVTLVGWETAPAMGRIVEVGPDYFDFEAFRGDGGTTSFDYRVRDRWGAESVSSITVGIAQPSDVNQAPQAALDTVLVRPDRAVAVSVLDNDSDPDGDEVGLVSVNVEDAPAEFVNLRLGEDSPTVNFTAPSEPGEYTLEYTIQDARGATAVGAIRVQVDVDAPLLPPRAFDDIVDVADVAAGDPFVVPVLENDRDPDGDPSELVIEVLTGEGRAVPGGVEVVPTDEFQIITYRVTDQDGGHAEAFVFIPGAGVQLPYIASDTKLYVGSGELLEIPLDRVVEMPNGGTARITTEETVSATNDNEDSLVADEHNLVYTSEPGYVGDAAISFEVTDGSGPDDPDAVTARLTVPIVVTPSSQVSPEFHGAEIRVEPGEAPTEFDLRSATWDPDDGDIDRMEYDLLSGSAADVNVRVDGQTLVVSAETDAAPGTRGSYEIELQDPAGNLAPGVVIVEVVTSSRPLPRAETDTAETDQGVEISVNVVANDFNPFQNIGEPLNVRDVRVLRGDA